MTDLTEERVREIAKEVAQELLVEQAKRSADNWKLIGSLGRVGNRGSPALRDSGPTSIPV